MEGLRIGERLPLDGDKVASTVFRSGHTARIDSFESATGARVGAPIVVDERIWGLAVVGSSHTEPLSADTEERIAEFADLVATAIAAATTRAELIASRARIVAAADNARRRLERDLHDGAQQRLVGLGMKARAAQAHALPEQTLLTQELSEVVAGLDNVSKELQEISRGIHPAILSTGGLGPALKTLARRSTVPVNLDIAIEQRLPDAVEVAAYYVVAEALTNAAKHAQASRVTVSADAQQRKLRLSISDDGIGGADTGKGSGLIGLKDRVAVLGGQMHISSQPGRGTSVNVAIPLGGR